MDNFLRFSVGVFVVFVVLLVIGLILIRKTENFHTTEFSGKVVLITGGTSGIGLATAILFAQHGARVYVCGRNKDRWIKNKNSVPSNIANRITYISCDVRIENQVEKMIDQIGRIDIAINNAGVAGGTKITDQTIQSQLTPKDISWFLSNQPNEKCPPGTTNPLSTVCENPIFTDGIGVLYCIKHEIKNMEKYQTPGAIVNTASVNSLWGSPGGAVYSMAKGMVKLLTQSVAAYQAGKRPLIRINCVAPGSVNTPLIQAQFPPNTSQQIIQQEASAGIPLGRMAEPSEIAHGILFLSSNKQASYITGTTLIIDGGLTAAPNLQVSSN